jgi:sugar (pentulose or hexulose) kinase
MPGPATVFRDVEESMYDDGSLALGVRHCFEEIRFGGEMAPCGGSPRPELCTAVFDDVLGRPLILPDDTAAGAGGGAMIVWAALRGPGQQETLPFTERPYQPGCANRASTRGVSTSPRSATRHLLAVETETQWK